MSFLSSMKNWFKKKEKTEKDLDIESRRVSVAHMESRFAEEDLVGAAKILKNLLEVYAYRKRKNHRTKGREFIHFILSNKHKDLKNTGYTHWQNFTQIILLNHKKAYPYHKKNLREAMDFFEKEIRGLNTIDVIIDKPI